MSDSMIGMTFAQAKAGFFDREKIEKAIDAKTKRALGAFGAAVRQRDRTSMKYATSKRTVSAPGQPPVIHRTLTRTKTNKKGVAKTVTVSPLRDFTFFAAEQDSLGRWGVVIGPALMNGHDATPLRTIEEGGAEKVTDAKGQTRTRYYRPRPHTGPAFHEELRKLPGLLGR